MGARSPGALDDASGVVTVLRAIELLPRDLSIGVLLTSAEELGLAGAARAAWARGAGARRFAAINVDGVDDAGAIRANFHGPRCHARSPPCSAAAATRGRALRRLPPGALMDGVALADAGWDGAQHQQGELAHGEPHPHARATISRTSRARRGRGGGNARARDRVRERIGVLIERRRR